MENIPKKITAFDVVFEDKYLIVLNKKAKILTLPTPNKEKTTLFSILQEKLKERGERAYPVHRLDRETTGLIIFAKNPKIQKYFFDEFKKKRVIKKYIAFCLGCVKKKEGTIKGFILDREGRKYGESKQFAITKYNMIERRKNFSVAEIVPITGKTNQIRIQFRQIGHPLLGERKYAFGRDFPREARFNRVALHSNYLMFWHPFQRQKMTFKIGLPRDMKEFLEEHY